MSHHPAVPSAEGFLNTYRKRLDEGWQPDTAQAAAATRLDALLTALRADTPEPPKGLWLYGPPGRGKSQLLDLFMSRVQNPAKRRIHFHAFMEEIHRRLHALPVTTGGADPLARLSDELAAEAAVLGFDEFYLTNIADAMLLGRLMKLLFQRGVVVVATSNWGLPDLFQGGLNRDRFLPFLRLMESHLEPVDLRNGPDYRLSGAHGGHSLPPHYIVTEAGESAEAQLLVLFHEFGQGPTQGPLKGWPAKAIKRRQGRAVWLTFTSACDAPRSRSDYAQLAAHFDTILIEGIPQLTASDADAALRLATLVDILYEQRRRLVVSAAAAPGQLCRPEEGRNAAAQVFQRTASRLMEMTQDLSPVPLAPISH